MQNADSCKELKPEEKLYMDKRSKRVIFLSHCVLNQNAMIDGLACYPGVFREVVNAILASDCGIVQLECPEMNYLGLDRKVDIDSVRNTASEDSRVRILMEQRSGRSCCRKIAEKAGYQIEQYLLNGFVVAGVLGINASPTCGVETTWSDRTEIPGPGVFFRELQKVFQKRNLSIPVYGLNLNNPVEAAEVVRKAWGSRCENHLSMK